MKHAIKLSAIVSILLIGLGLHAYSLEYLSKSAVDAAKLLPSPPSADSDETKAELKLILQLQKDRSSEQVERCQAEAKLTMSAFESVMGPWFTSENLPETEMLFKQIHTEAKTFTDAAKKHFNRPRPQKVESRIKSAIEKEKDDEASYPSGHATRGILYAMILSQIEPEKKDALMRRGREIGWDRVIAGVHYPSDVAAGRMLGQALGQALLADPKFQEKLSIAKAECMEMKNKNNDTQLIEEIKAADVNINMQQNIEETLKVH